MDQLRAIRFSHVMIFGALVIPLILASVSAEESLQEPVTAVKIAVSEAQFNISVSPEADANVRFVLQVENPSSVCVEHISYHFSIDSSLIKIEGPEGAYFNQLVIISSYSMRWQNRAWPPETLPCR